MSRKILERKILSLPGETAKVKTTKKAAKTKPTKPVPTQAEIKACKAMADYAEKLGGDKAFEVVKTAFGAAKRELESHDELDEEDDLLDFLRLRTVVREQLAWQLAKQVGLEELRDECFASVETILSTAFAAHADF